jgi:CRISPR-associated protein (TIGR02710 family)
LDLHGDPSGGTKAMSAALAMVLLEQNGTISLVSGDRTNLMRIEHSDGSRSISVGTIKARQLLLDHLPPLLKRHLYDQASVLLQELRRNHQRSLDQITLTAIDELRQCLAVLMRWDRFEWQQALDAASQTVLVHEKPELITWWQSVVKAHTWIVDAEPQDDVTGYELVQDLLLNAERRGRRGWYDDAVARLYRALELLAQTYIQLELGIDHLEFWDDPDIQRDCREWRVRRGVGGLYWWLKHHEGGTGLGGAASSQWHALQELLNARNNCLLGHGLQPVNSNQWRDLQSRVTNLVAIALNQAGFGQGRLPVQLPGTALLDLSSARHLLGDVP